MQGCGLLTFILMLSFSVMGFAQDEFDDFNSEPAAPGAESPSPLDGEPDPGSALRAPPSPSSGDEMTEFEESGGGNPNAIKNSPPTPPPAQEAKPAPAPPANAPQPQPAPQPLQTVPAPTATAVPEPTAPPPPDVESPEPKVSRESVKPLKSRPAPAPKISFEADAGPDYSREEQFHRFYNNYSKQPTSDESWAKATGAGKSQIYDVQSGDTLWDVSQTLFGDSQFWPKIWSLNNDTVLNPHQITPSMKIKFFPGGLLEAPTVAVQNAEPPPLTSAPLAKNETGAPTVTDVQVPAVPKPYRRSKKLKNIPPSLPLARFGQVSKAPQQVEIFNGRKKLESPLVYLSHYVTDTEPTGVGTITETEDGARTASEFKYVIVHLDDPTQKIVHVVRDVEDVSNPLAGVFRNKGRMIEVGGELKILSKVNDEENLYRAQVTKNIAQVAIGGLLLPGPLPKVDVVPSEVVAAPEAALIGGQYSAVKKLYRNYSFVFIDGGTTMGLQEGETVNVYANLQMRNAGTAVKTNNRILGQVKIIRTTPNFSTAYVVNAFQDLQIGDHIGGAATVAADEKPQTAPVQKADSGLEAGGDEDLDL